MTSPMATNDTHDGLPYEPCGDTKRHGSHTWGYDGSDGLGTVEYRCGGYGLITVSYSELDTFRQCPLKHELAYGQRWTKEHSDTSALGLGTLWHRVLECHYNTIKAAQITGDDGESIVWSVSEDDLFIAVRDAVNSLLDKMLTDEQRDPDVIKTLRWMYEGHLKLYGLDDGWDILAVETTAVITINEPDGHPSWVRLKVKIDLLVRDQHGRVWVVDHKSASQIGRDDKDLDWDDQFGMYVAAMRQQGLNVVGAIHSAALKKSNKGDLIKPEDDGYKSTMKETPLENRFKRSMLNRTEPECASILEDARADAVLAYSEANHKRRHANPDTCKWKCDYKEACIFGRRTNNDANVLLTLQRTGFSQEPGRH